MSPDGNTIVSGSHDKTIVRWHAVTGQQIGQPLIGHADWVLSVVISKNARKIVSGSADCTIRIWAMEYGNVLQVLQGHSDSVLCVKFSIDEKFIFSASADKLIKIWDAAQETK